jgi:hypothetical protein
MKWWVWHARSPNQPGTREAHGAAGHGDGRHLLAADHHAQHQRHRRNQERRRGCARGTHAAGGNCHQDLCDGRPQSAERQQTQKCAAFTGTREISHLHFVASQYRRLTSRKSKVVTMAVYYLEIVSNDVDTLIGLYQRMHGLSFGPTDPDLGHALVASLSAFKRGSCVSTTLRLSDSAQLVSNRDHHLAAARIVLRSLTGHLL